MLFKMKTMITLLVLSLGFSVIKPECSEEEQSCSIDESVPAKHEEVIVSGADDVMVDINTLPDGDIKDIEIDIKKNGLRPMQNEMPAEPVPVQGPTELNPVEVK